LKKTILIFIGLFFIGFSANAGPISFSVLRGLDFPEIIPDLNGGTIERYRGRRNITNVATFVDNGIDARIRVQGDANEEFEVEIIGSSLTGPGGAMLVHDFQVRDGPTFTFSGTGRFTIRNIGGQLDYAIGQTAGSYNGSIQIRARYTVGLGIWYSETISVTAEISAQSILIVERDELNFGQVTPDPNGSVVAMDSAGNMSNVSGNSFFHGGNQRGLFRIGGQANSVVYISMPNAPLSKGSDDLKLFDIECNRGTSFTLTSSGAKYIRTFGKIDIPASPTPGVYTGTYDVIINY